MSKSSAWLCVITTTYAPVGRCPTSAAGASVATTSTLPGTPRREVVLAGVVPLHRGRQRAQHLHQRAADVAVAEHAHGERGRPHDVHEQRDAVEVQHAARCHRMAPGQLSTRDEHARRAAAASSRVSPSVPRCVAGSHDQARGHRVRRLPCGRRPQTAPTRERRRRRHRARSRRTHRRRRRRAWPRRRSTGRAARPSGKRTSQCAGSGGVAGKRLACDARSPRTRGDRRRSCRRCGPGVTTIAAPLSRGVEPAAPATVTSTARSPQATAACSASCQARLAIMRGSATAARRSRPGCARRSPVRRVAAPARSPRRSRSRRAARGTPTARA